MLARWPGIIVAIGRGRSLSMGFGSCAELHKQRGDMAMFEQLIYLAVDTARYNRGLASVQWGLTAVGISIILVGAGLSFSKTKDGERKTSPALRWISMVLCGLIGLGIIAYGWLAFSPL